jgi:hypothetical protein
MISTTMTERMMTWLQERKAVVAVAADVVVIATSRKIPVVVDAGGIVTNPRPVEAGVVTSLMMTMTAKHGVDAENARSGRIPILVEAVAVTIRTAVKGVDVAGMTRTRTRRGTRKKMKATMKRKMTKPLMTSGKMNGLVLPPPVADVATARLGVIVTRMIKAEVIPPPGPKDPRHVTKVEAKADVEHVANS